MITRVLKWLRRNCRPCVHDYRVRLRNGMYMPVERQCRFCGRVQHRYLIDPYVTPDWKPGEHPGRKEE